MPENKKKEKRIWGKSRLLENRGLTIFVSFVFLFFSFVVYLVSDPFTPGLDQLFRFLHILVHLPFFLFVNQFVNFLHFIHSFFLGKAILRVGKQSGLREAGGKGGIAWIFLFHWDIYQDVVISFFVFSSLLALVFAHI